MAFGFPSADLANVVLTAAAVEEACGDFPAALRLAERAAGAAAPIANSDDPALISLWGDIEVTCGQLLSTLGDFAAAECRLSAVAEKVGGVLAAEHPCRLSIENARGVNAKHAGRFEQARKHYDRLLKVLEKQCVNDEYALADVLHNLGGLHHAEGRPVEGLVHAERGLRLRIRAVGESAVDVARDLNAVGALHHDSGNHLAAEAAYRQALTIFEKAFGPTHYEVGVTCANLAVTTAARHEVAAARALYTRALSILEHSVGHAHPDVALVQHNLAVLEAEQGEVGSALALLQKAESILGQALTVQHPRRADLQVTLADVTSRCARS
jgi:tetratricopeptide (TPR) repeat protein